MNSQNIKYISLFEAAKLTNYSQEYISLLCRQKKMKGAKIGRNWATTKEWIEDYINKTKGNGQNIIPIKIKSAEDKKLGSEASEPSFLSSLAENMPAGDSVSPTIGKLILTAIICSLFVSGFIFLQLGFQKETIKINPPKAIEEAGVNIAQGIVSISDHLNLIKNGSMKLAADEIISASNSMDIVKSESIKLASYKITAAGNALDNIKNKTISSLKNLKNEKSNPRVAGVEDLNESDSVISDKEIDLTSKENKGMVIVPLEGGENSQENIDMINKISSSFSDDVDVKPNEDGASGIINPKNNPEENYLYLMVPVKKQ